MRVVLIMLVLLGISLVLALALSNLVCLISDNQSLRILTSFPSSSSFKNVVSAKRGECWYPRTLPKSPTATYKISGRKQICYDMVVCVKACLLDTTTKVTIPIMIHQHSTTPNFWLLVI